MGKHVIILGGGVGGLTAAHELSARGFRVTVLEARGILGGKARSMEVPNSGRDGRSDLPGEHGFRFFPGFYRHLTDTMSRIPFREATVLANLVPVHEVQIARRGSEEAALPIRIPSSPEAMNGMFGTLFSGADDLAAEDLRYFVERLLTLLTSCRERRFSEYEYQSWWQFIGAEQRSTAYRKLCADGLTRTLVAARAREMSARTGGTILLQLLLDFVRPGVQVDRVLNGPTNEVWIDPWVAFLRARGVRFVTGAEVRELRMRDGRISGVSIERLGEPSTVTGDYYVCALPVEVTAGLITAEIRAADPTLGRLHRLKIDWMTGVQFYLDTDVSIARGHTLYIDSPWALTSISQTQFWKDFAIERHGDGRVKAILSVDVSDWNTPGYCGKPAKHCSPEEIRAEVWRQLQEHLNEDQVRELGDARVLHWFLDPAIVYDEPGGRPRNQECLLINTAGSWEDRPEAVTRIANLTLAADYVRTHTDLATMEAANEAARRAVNGILAAEGVGRARCAVWKLQEPGAFGLLRRYDRARYRKGLAHDPALIRFALRLVMPVWRVQHLSWRALWFGLQGIRLAMTALAPDFVRSQGRLLVEATAGVITRILLGRLRRSVEGENMRQLWMQFAQDPELLPLMERHRNLEEFVDAATRRSMSEEMRRRVQDAEKETWDLEQRINEKIRARRLEAETIGGQRRRWLFSTVMTTIALALSIVSLWMSARTERQELALTREKLQILETQLLQLQAKESLASPVRLPTTRRPAGK